MGTRASDISGAHPGVSYVMPVLNEVDYLEAAVDSILAQDYPGEVELVLALGPSNDGTADIVDRLLEREPRIRVVENPGMDIPIGLNLAIAESRYPVIIRVDAHTELAPGYTARGVAELQRTGAASLGGIMVATGKPGFQAAVAQAYNSRFGLGGGAYHGEGAQPGPAESAYMGIFRRDMLDQVGGFDETLRRGEDWELNYRLRKAGHTVWLDPGLRVSYWPRSSAGKLARQFRATGIWRGELVRRLGRGNSLRFFAPPVLLINLIVAALVAVLHLTGVLNGVVGIVVGVVVYLGPALYLGLLLLAAVTARGSLADRLRFVAVLVIMHLSWGAGFIVGLVRGAGDAVDTSRTES